jgi:DNA-directed RNA polymerase specialized sigma24 family protein
MGELLGLIKKHRDAGSLEKRRDVAEAVAKYIAPSLFLYILRRAPEAVSELRGDVLAEITKSLPGCRAISEGEAWGWCYTITRRKLAAHFKAETANREIPMGADDLTRLIDSAEQVEPFANEAQRLDGQEAVGILKSANPKCFEILWDFFVVGRTFKEIAERTKLKYDNVRRKVTRCVEKAKSLLGSRFT